jgi:hypothetical protein
LICPSADKPAKVNNMEGSVMKNALLLCLAVLLWSCDTPRSYGPETPYYHFPEGSRLVLNRALEIPATWATVRLQFGKVVAFGHVQEQAPYCIFEINTVREVAQRVEPDIFAIVKVGRSISPIAARPSFFIRAAYGFSDRTSQMFYKTIFTLRSERQPGVLQMVCQSDQYAAGITIPRHLTVPEIHQALGDIFTLELP